MKLKKSLKGFTEQKITQKLNDTDCDYLWLKKLQKYIIGKLKLKVLNEFEQKCLLSFN
jgi:hypothetical protein